MTDDRRPLDGKVAIITGGGSGIGRATAKLFATRGAKVAVTGRTEAKLAGVVAEIEALGGEALAVAMDVAQEESVRAGFAATVARFGRLDIVHSNAAQTGAMFEDALIGDMDIDFWNRTLTTNLTSAMLCAKHGVPHLIAAGGGSIIFTGSGKGVGGDLDYPAYGTSKAGLIGLSKYVATQYGKQKVRANVIVVGLVMTEALDENMPSEAQTLMKEHNLMPDLGRPEDIAEVAAFLASDQSRYVTGASIVADGGFTAHSAVYADMMRFAAMKSSGA
ncbi:SDR family NAD(P)-dependent oxidoreductase [Sphingomonas solaris]|uniref:SDR family oxidoreductase n=1 Tax=Alterirhizorhabdus solaris TaxID=2529389 RepID=A0A558RCQ6_9SPHN|nr:SDR family oxidoreductase [Sphingomonas solaris]TVV77134.1 SDR family oxidoreductase [Sphingomonas solaris]